MKSMKSLSLERLAHQVKGSVATVDELAGGIEALLLTVAARVAVWMAALPTIALSARTIRLVFALDTELAWASAVALELVGQSVVNAWLKAKEWNAHKNKSDAAANEQMLLGFSAVYFVSDFLLVGALEVPLALAGEWVHLTALLFPLMQVVSTVITAERAAQYRREAAAAAAKAERAASRAKRARAKKAAQASARDARESETPAREPRHPAPIRLNKRGFRREVARLNGELAPLADKLRAPGANRADVLNAWLNARGFERVPPGTARGWVPVVLEAARGSFDDAQDLRAAEGVGDETRDN